MSVTANPEVIHMYRFTKILSAALVAVGIAMCLLLPSHKAIVGAIFIVVGALVATGMYLAVSEDMCAPIAKPVSKFRKVN